MEEFKISDFAKNGNYNPYPPEFPKGNFISLILLSVFCFLLGAGALYLGFYDVDNFTYALVMAASLILGGFLLYHNAKKLLQEHRAEVKEFKMEEAFRNEHEDEIFYTACIQNNISALDRAGIARMKIVAKQRGMTCSEDVLIDKYEKGEKAARDRRKAVASQETKNRILDLQKEERAKEQLCKKYIYLSGLDKRLKECYDRLEMARARLSKLDGNTDTILRGTEAIYSQYAGKETDWAVHGGIASAIAGPAAGVAVAADIQRKNAEIRESNAQLRQAANQFAQPLLLDNIKQKADAKRTVESLERELEETKNKLVEELPQDQLLSRLSPQIVETKTSETGAITATVSYTPATLMIYDTVKASIDGSFKVIIMDGERLAGEAYFTLPYGGSRYAKKLTSICTSLPAGKKGYTFVFKPHNLCAIEL